ncbi:allophanate hydrolase-related protein [Lentzea fradiae]
MALIFLNGGGMRGGPLHSQLQGTPMVCRARSAPRYRYFSVRGTFPAMHESGSASVTGELYDLPLKVLRDHLVPAEPAELEIGVIELEDGSAALATVLRDAVVDELLRTGDIEDISYLGDWRAFLHREG